MYNALISIAAAVAVTLIFGFLLGGGDLRITYGIIPGLLTAPIAYVILARRTMKQLQALVGRAQQPLQGQNIDQGVEILKEGYALSKWQFFVEAQIDAQIGTILYMAQRFDEAEPFLKRSFKKNWIARAMLGTLYYKQKKHDKMKAVFEEAVTANKKESLLWNLYAYCLWKSGDRDEAIDVLNRAIDKAGDDKRTKKNLKQLKNGRRMKMRAWNMQWYQFHLDRPPAMRHQPQFQRR